MRIDGCLRTVLPLQPGQLSDQTVGPIPHAVVRAAVNQVIAASTTLFDTGQVVARMVEGLVDPVTDLPELGLRLRDLITLVGDAA